MIDAAARGVEDVPVVGHGRAGEDADEEAADTPGDGEGDDGEAGDAVGERRGCGENGTVEEKDGEFGAGQGDGVEDVFDEEELGDVSLGSLNFIWVCVVC